jgi:hypothetical protein
LIIFEKVTEASTEEGLETGYIPPPPPPPVDCVVVWTIY